MKKPALKKLLVAVDGSEKSMDTVQQLGRIAPFREGEVVLFHAFSGMPEAYLDLAKEPTSSRHYAYVRAWESQQRMKIQEFMERARQHLLGAGFDANRIAIIIQQRKKGIARDILLEAARGYSAVVLRRRGMGQIGEIVMGSVAIKVLEKGAFLPLLIFGQMPVNDRYLIALDGSEDAQRAVDFSGEMLKGYGGHVQLTHIIREVVAPLEEGGVRSMSEEFLEDARQAILPVFEKARQCLLDGGSKAEEISTKIIASVASRAVALAREAKEGDFGTIILGRRGLSRVQEFYMGRVSNKVIQLARKHSVWVIP